MAQESVTGETGERHIAFATGEGPNGEATAMELVEVDDCYLIRDYVMEGPKKKPYVLCAAYDAPHAFNSWFKWSGDQLPAYQHSRGRL